MTRVQLMVMAGVLACAATGGWFARGWLEDSQRLGAMQLPKPPSMLPCTRIDDRPCRRGPPGRTRGQRAHHRPRSHP